MHQPGITSTGQQRRRGQMLLFVVGGVVVAAAVLAGLLALRKGGVGSEAGTNEIQQVVRTNMDVMIPSSGELAAFQQTDVVNMLGDNFKAVITEIVEEGKSVKKDEVLVRLADEEVQLKIKDAEDEVNVAEKALVAAESKLSIQRNAADSDLAKADLAIELAKLALEAWQQGDMMSQRKKLETGVETAKIDLDRLEAKFLESQKLLDAGFLSKDEYELDRIALVEARSTLDQATIDLDVFNTYKVKEEQAKKQSDLDQANAERGRVKERTDAEIVTASADVESAKFKLQSARDRLARLQQQFASCTIRAPRDGLVIYASSVESNRWGGNDNPIKVGAQLYPNQTIIILPDTSQMTANVKVNEALAGRVKPGQRAIVYSDAMPNAPMTGEVYSVSVLAETGGWRDPNRRDYTVRVRLDGELPSGLKPSMRCRAEIFVERIENCLSVPIQAVLRNGPLAYVYVPDGSGYSQQKVETGRASEMRVEIISGLAEGDRVLLREPSPEQVVSRLPLPNRENTSNPAGEQGPAVPASKKSDSAAGKKGRDAKPEAEASAAGTEVVSPASTTEASSAS